MTCISDEAILFRTMLMWGGGVGGGWTSPSHDCSQDTEPLRVCVGSTCHLTTQGETEQEVLLQSVICVYCLEPWAGPGRAGPGWGGHVVFGMQAETLSWLRSHRHAVTSRAC